MCSNKDTFVMLQVKYCLLLEIIQFEGKLEKQMLLCNHIRQPEKKFTSKLLPSLVDFKKEESQIILVAKVFLENSHIAKKAKHKYHAIYLNNSRLA